MRRSFLLGAAAGVALGSLPLRSQADTVPTGPVRLVVPAAPGGLADTTARLLAERLSAALKVQVIVDNRPGGGQVIGSDFVAKSPPDGNTLLFASADHSFNPFLRPQMPYDTARDFAPIGLVGSVPLVLTVYPDLVARSVADLIGLARSQPGKVNYGSAGAGSTTHLAGELFRVMARVDVVHVPYKGTAQAFTELLGRQIDFMFPPIASVGSYLQSGRLRAMAVCSATRSPRFPNVPAMTEVGVPGYEAPEWFGLLAPTGTPSPLVARLNAELQRVLLQPEVRTRLLEQGFVLQPGSPEDFAAKIHADMERWGKVIKDAGIRL